jgi:hypothetical protein
VSHSHFNNFLTFGFWVLANTKTQRVAFIILIIFSHLASCEVFGFLDFRSAAPEHVDSENIKLKIGPRTFLFSKRDF